MADDTTTPKDQPDRTTDTDGTRFKREGFPSAEGTGRTVEEMNELAEEALQQNVRPTDTREPK